MNNEELYKQRLYLAIVTTYGANGSLWSDRSTVRGANAKEIYSRLEKEAIDRAEMVASIHVEYVPE